ncbi:hypothetical protein KM043_015431 [Ampulex compressa]|nr:hypothetical protein KM043_015431 [Ampulex compressa]
MKCVVPGANVKILARAIHALAKVGDELYVQPQENALSFRTVNMANSAYADFTFFENYFSYYILGNLQQDDILKCKISMRSAMAVFKAPNTLDKQVETCHIKLKSDASELLFILKYKNGINKIHLLPILDCEKLQATYSKTGVPNKLCAQPRVLSDAVQNFQQNLIEITFDVSQPKLLLRNYVDDTSSASNVTRTQLVLTIGEFDQYVIGNETTITFCMKELRAILGFAELVGTPINIHFEVAGRPVVFVLENPSFEVNLVLSTLNPDADTESETTLHSKPEKSGRKRVIQRKTTKKINKSSSKIEKVSAKNDKLLNSTITKTRNPQTVEREQEVIRVDTAVSQVRSKESDSLFGSDDMDVLRPITNERNENHTLIQDNHNRDIFTTPSSSGINRERNATSLTGKKLANTIFPMIAKRKNNDVKNQDNGNVLEDTIPRSPSPPNKKARLIFKKCFQTTFDPRMLPGHDIILAEDSDENCSD